MLHEHRRPDGRAFDQIRPITIETGVLPRTHGSAIFTRGETQALVTVTLGTKDDEQRIELLEPGETLQALHAALQFPAVQRGRSGLHARTWPARNRPRRAGGAGRLCRSTRRRRSFPTPCVWSATFSNPTDRARWRSVCGASLALMDAGVPIWAPVGGVAMGLVKEGDKYAILTDIAGRRRPLRRYGLQGGRHARRHHRAADGHQGAERHHRAS